MRLFGAADNDISAFECSQEDVDDDFYVYEDNWPVLCWFLDVSDQFNYTQGVCTGVNLIGIQSDAQMSGREYTPEQYSSLRFLMRMAVRELNASMERK